MKNNVFDFIRVALLIIFSVFNIAPVLAVDIPHAFYGELMINGALAPIGTIVEARGNGVMTGIDGNPIITTEVGMYGGPVTFDPKLYIQGNITEGTILTFYVNGVAANETAGWHSGQVSELNLSIATMPIVEVKNSPAPLPIDQTIVIPVEVKNFVASAGMGAYDFVLSFDPVGLRMNNVLEGDSPFGAPDNFTIDNVLGRVSFNDVLIHDHEVPGPTGSIILARIVFQTLRVGRWEIDPTIISLLDTAGNEISAIPDSGIIEVAAPVCETQGDSDNDGKIGNLEILNHVRKWKAGEISILEILKTIRFWKAGAGC